MKLIAPSCITLLLAFGATYLLTANDPPELITRETIDGIYKKVDEDSPKPEILDVVKQLEKLLLRIDKNNPTDELGYLYHVAGRNYSYLGDTYYETAISYIKKAIEVRLKLPQTPELQVELGKSYYNLGSYSIDSPTPIKNIVDAIIGFEKAAELLHETPVFVSMANNGLGKAYEERGDFGEAIRYFQLAQKMAESDAEKSKALIGEARCLNYIGQYDQATPLFEMALSLIPTDNSADRFVAYENMGIGFEFNGNLAKALECYTKSEPFSHIEHGVNLNLINDFGRAYRKNKEFDKAITILEEGLKIAVVKDKGMVPYLLDNLGEVYLAQHSYADALTYFEKAKKSILAGANMDSSNLWIVSIEDKPMLFISLYDKGRALSLLKDSSSQALKAFIDADRVVSAMRREQISETSKLSWRKKVSDLYASALKVCLKGGHTNEAFTFIENSKSALLSDQLAELSAKNIIGPYYDRVLTGLQNELLIARNKYRDTPGSVIENTIINIQKEIKSIQDTISMKYPEYATARYNTTQVSIDELKSQLNDTSVYVSYFVSDSISYAFAVSNNEGPFLVPLSLDQSFIQKVDTLLIQAAVGTSFNRLTYRRLAYDIYQRILEPVFNQFRQRFGKSIIVPDGIIAKVPFDALISQPFIPSEKLYEAPYLIKSMQTQQVWSASAFVYTKKKNRTHQPVSQVTFVAPKEFNQTGFGPLHKSSDLISATLNQVFESNKIVEFLDTAANRLNLEAVGAKSVLLHAHTHADLDALGRPYLLLYQDSISMEDFYRIRFETDVCILGACKTNLGNYERAEGVFSLTRAISGAGASSTISSLWEVNDEISAKLFNHFYHYLCQGDTKANALHKAKLEILQSGGVTSFPAYWAAWTFTGTDNVINLERKISIQMWLLISVTLLVGLFTFRYVLLKQMG